MSEPLTDERLAAIEDRWTENGLIHGDIHTLIQEVRRLRTALDVERFNADEALLSHEAHLEKAEAEVERLRKWKADNERTIAAGLKRLNEALAERDRYKEALKEIVRMAREPHLQIARAAEVAQAALQAPVREEGEEE